MRMNWKYHDYKYYGPHEIHKIKGELIKGLMEENKLRWGLTSCKLQLLSVAITTFWPFDYNSWDLILIIFFNETYN